MSFNDGAGNPATVHCAAKSLSSGSATCTVSYASTGVYPVTATYTGDGAMNDHAASASTTQPVTVVAPAVGPAVAPTPPPPTLTLSNRTVTRCMGTAKGARRNVTVGYTVSAPSRVTFTLQRRVKSPGGKRTTCPRARTPGDYVNVRRASAAPAAVAKTRVLTTTVSVGAGAHAFRLKTLLGSTTLKPGRYRVLVQAVSTARAKAQHAVYFWVLQAKRKKASAR